MLRGVHADYRGDSALNPVGSFLPCGPPQRGTAGASPWHLWNDPHPRSSPWRLRLPAPAKPPRLLDAEGIRKPENFKTPADIYNRQGAAGTHTFRH